MSIHTIAPSNFVVPEGYLDEDNVRFVQRKITEVLKREFYQDILFDRTSILKLMERALSDRRETVPKMNQRAVMYGTNEYRIHMLEADKHMMWEENFEQSQQIFDPTTANAKVDLQGIKLSQRLGVPKVGGTTRFYFT